MTKPNRARRGTGTHEAAQGTHGKADGPSRERIIESLMEGLLLGAFSAPTPIEEMTKMCPALWKRAVRIFGGNKAAARDWMDKPSALLGGEPPLRAVLRTGGARKVLRALGEATRLARKRRTGPVKLHKKPTRADARSDRGNKLRTNGQYQQALARIDTLTDAKAGTAEGDELDPLSRLVWDYERQTSGA